MNGVAVATGAARLVEKRDVGRGRVIVDVLQADVHGTDRDGELLELREQVEEVVRGQGELCGLHIVRGEFEGAKRQGRSEC